MINYISYNIIFCEIISLKITFNTSCDEYIKKNFLVLLHYLNSR